MSSLPMIDLHIYLPIDLIQELDKKVKDRTFKSRADAIRSYCTIGIRVEQLKTEIKNPEFLKSIQELKKNDSLFEWLSTLTDQEEDAIAYAIKIDKEKRFKQTTLR